MSVGTMRSFVRLRIPVAPDDGEGGQQLSWTNGPKFWADIRPLSAREQAIAGALQSIVTLRAEMHYDTRITVERRLQRIEPTGPELQILGVRDPDGRKRKLELDCAEVV